MLNDNKNTTNFLCFFLMIVIGGCSLLGGGSNTKNPRGQLVGTSDRDGFEMISEYGMVYVPTGRFYMDK